MHNLKLDTLDLLSINILVNLYEHHSATFVAKQMNISAPKISRCLQHSRVIFNNPLFIRKKHGLIPNEFAKQLYPIAKEIVQCSEHLYQLNAGDSHNETSHFTIHVSDLIVHHLPQLLANAIKESHLDLKFTISADSDDLITDIIENRIDIALISESGGERLKQLSEQVDLQALKRLSHLYLVCDLHHPLLRQEITLETIAQYPYVSVLGEPQQANIDPFIRYCSQHQLAYQLKNEDLTNHNFNIESLSQHITATDAVALLPYSKVYDHSSQLPNLHVCRLSEIETERLYLSIQSPTLYLASKKGLRSPNAAWLVDTIGQIVNRSIH
ncbi:LysR family transcriptional regulator [uncultured Shewanella sp.]|uniref:LysR family transcriptional regulator n=1 Tax=Shewanella atlantica TaxID=271099 RepID=UPI0026124EF2|nr:LysR family transcriptional regulator [uncultured Shewanella sp.]